MRIVASYKLRNGGAACKLKVDHGLTYEDAKGLLQDLRDRGVDREHAFFAKTRSGRPKLVHWRTRTTYRSWGVTGRPSTGQVDHLPERVVVDEAYQREWDATLRQEPPVRSSRFEELLVVELPALSTLVALGRAEDTKLVKLQEEGSTRLAVQVPVWYAHSIDKLLVPAPATEKKDEAGEAAGKTDETTDEDETDGDGDGDGGGDGDGEEEAKGETTDEEMDEETDEEAAKGETTDEDGGGEETDEDEEGGDDGATDIPESASTLALSVEVNKSKRLLEDSVATEEREAEELEEMARVKRRRVKEMKETIKGLA